MKILVATGAYPPDIGGPATYSHLLHTELPGRGISVDVLSFGTVRHLPKGIRHLVYFSKLVWHGRASDVIFAQDTVSVGLPALAASYLLGNVFMVRVPGDYAWEQSTQRYGVTDSIDDFQKKRYGSSVERLRRLQRLVVNSADRVVVPSAYFAGIVRSWMHAPEKVIHIYNGIDLAEIRTAAAGALPEPQTIMSAGRLVPWKGFGMLIRAMKRLPGWKLAIAGDGPEKGSLEKLIAAEGLADRVALLGRIGRADLARRIAGSELFALNTSYETFSFQLVEAMAAGAPVIATRIGNLAEIVDDGRDGLLIAPDDEARFVAAVEQLHADPSARQAMGAAARAKAESFSIAATLDRLIATVREVADGHEETARKRRVAAKIVRYLFSGGIAAITNLLLLYLFTSVAHIWYLLSSILSFIFAFMVSFTLQKFFTFQDHATKGIHGQALIYLVVTGSNLGVNTLLIYLFVEYAGLHYLLAQIVTSILVAIESFIIYNMFVFKAPAE
jgi:glycosyltransferase involved in cell wall biosynthesis/putative flippase GtrA